MFMIDRNEQHARASIFLGKVGQYPRYRGQMAVCGLLYFSVCRKTWRLKEDYWCDYLRNSTVSFPKVCSEAYELQVPPISYGAAAYIR